MDDARFDRARVSAAFDAYGEREWSRHDETPMDRVAFHIHRAFLERYVRPGERVLDAGAGPGRFTIELARLGASVTVVDISVGQLGLNERYVREAGAEGAVTRRELGDVVDLSEYDDAAFDVVVCYGAVLSFVTDRAGEGLDQLLRVARRDGIVLLGVASRFGALRTFIAGLRQEIHEDGVDWAERVVETGDLFPPHSSIGIPVHLYTWGELRTLLEAHGCEVLSASAANFVSTGDPAEVEAFAADGDLWNRFLAWELAACAQPGALDSGTHIIAAVRRR
jgi:2-polyprenyl-3-methyl-5-hydroxy-6-metoxy-1,4-benzoquinol methylase